VGAGPAPASREQGTGQPPEQLLLPAYLVRSPKGGRSLFALTPSRFVQRLAAFTGEEKAEDYAITDLQIWPKSPVAGNL
jgi:hypothetical protein